MDEIHLRQRKGKNNAGERRGKMLHQCNSENDDVYGYRHTACRKTTSAIPAAYRPGDESDIYLYAFTSFDEINEQVNSRLAGKVVSARGYTHCYRFHEGLCASAAGISVKITTSKDVEGTVVASGKLEFDTKHSK